MAIGIINAVGRRKEAVARVFLKPGTGVITINDRKFEEYFPVKQTQIFVRQPLNVLEVNEHFDVQVNLDGGGITGQAGALRMALARAMVKVDAENKPKLKPFGFLTRDSREVERKKPGQKKARKRFQFSKR